MSDKDQTPAEAKHAAELAPSPTATTGTVTPPTSAPNVAPQSAGLTEDAIRAIIRDELAKHGPLKASKTGATAGWYHDAGHSADSARLDAQQLRDSGAGINVPEKASE